MNTGHDTNFEAGGSSRVQRGPLASGAVCGGRYDLFLTRRACDWLLVARPDDFTAARDQAEHTGFTVRGVWRFGISRTLAERICDALPRYLWDDCNRRPSRPRVDVAAVVRRTESATNPHALTLEAPR